MLTLNALIIEHIVLYLNCETMSHIFISYSSKDRVLIDELAANLELLIDDVVVWYDRELNRSGGHQWWGLILEEIRRCDVFIYALSIHILKSEPCKREYSYALALGKPVLPVHIADIEIRYLPVELQSAQLVDFRLRTRDQQRSLKASIRNLPAASRLPEPMPEPPSVPLDPVGVILDFIDRLGTDLDQQRLVMLKIEDLAEDGAFQKFIPELLTRLIERDDVLTGRNLKRAQELQTRLLGSVQVTLPLVLTVPPQQKVAALPPVRRKASSALLHQPFAWIDIPGSKGKNWAGEFYRIARYPITNGQYQLFVNANGYWEKNWWTEAGWSGREREKWTEPRFWKDNKWNDAEQPVVGISWYESVAFCLWLSTTTGEQIMLPTEDQWQYAAQGDDERDYPWGAKWDANRCNNNVGGQGRGTTTSVRQYEGVGDSAFGVTDMVGNVYEWCLTDYDLMTNEINEVAARRVLRGGSWGLGKTNDFCCAVRGRNDPFRWFNSYGFRIVHNS